MPEVQIRHGRAVHVQSASRQMKPPCGFGLRGACAGRSAPAHGRRRLIPAAPFRDLYDTVSVEVRTRGRIANPGVQIVSIIPLDLQRKFEQRWAARFLRPPPAPRAHRPESHGQQLAAPKSKRKTRRVDAAGLRPLPNGVSAGAKPRASPSCSSALWGCRGSRQT